MNYMLRKRGRMHYLLPDVGGVPQCAHDEPLDPQTSVSPVMLVIVKVGFYRYLRLAIDSIRIAQDTSFPISSRRRDVLLAYRLLGIAEGYANVLFDTPCVAIRYLRTVNKVQAVAERLSKTLEMR